MMSEVMQPHLNCKHSGVMWRDTKVLSTQSSTAWWSLSAHWARLVSKLRVQWRMKLARHHLIVWTRLHTGTFFFSSLTHTSIKFSQQCSQYAPMRAHTHTHTQPCVDGVNPENSKLVSRRCNWATCNGMRDGIQSHTPCWSLRRQLSANLMASPCHCPKWF